MIMNYHAMLTNVDHVSNVSTINILMILLDWPENSFVNW